MENTFEGSGIDYHIEVAPVPPNTDFTPYVRANADFGAQLLVATGQGAISIEEIQEESGKRLPAKLFLCGSKIAPGALLN